MVVVTTLLLSPSTSRPCDLIWGNFSIFLTWWDFQSATSNQNTRPCHAHSLYEAAILVPITFVRISLHFLQPLQGRIVLDLHENFLKRHVQRRVLSTPSWRACLLTVSVFLLSRPSLLWTRTLFRVAREICFYSLNSLPLLGYNCVFCIHEVLGRMDEFSHGLRLFLVKLVDE